MYRRKSHFFLENNEYTSRTKHLVPHLEDLVNAGMGELLIQNVDREGTYKGYDIELMKFIADSVDIPVYCIWRSKFAR